MQPLLERTVREIAAANPASARVFERLGIDYCCGGNLSLSMACARAKVSVETAARLLDEAAQAPDRHPGDHPTLGALAAHIVETHHGFVREESPRILKLLAKVCGKHGEAHAELAQIQNLFTTLSEELSAHMLKEERILFPYVAALEGAGESGGCFPTVEMPIAVMISEHENAGAILEKMRTLSGGYVPPDGACASYRALYDALAAFERDLHWHVHLENNILFPRAIALEAGQRQAAATGSIPAGRAS